MFWYFYFLTKKSVSVELFRCSEANDLEIRHHMCPRTNTVGASIKQTKSMIQTYIKRSLVYQSQYEIKLNQFIQNNNEVINSVIWKRCPKDICVCPKTLELGVSSAVTFCNDGASRLINIINLIKIDPGVFCKNYCINSINYSINFPVLGKWNKNLQIARNRDEGSFELFKKVLLINMKNRKVYFMELDYFDLVTKKKQVLGLFYTVLLFIFLKGQVGQIYIAIL